ncbi:MAG: hypothetical protein P8Z49_01250 [Acidobacteriota bacterium]
MRTKNSTVLLACLVALFCLLPVSPAASEVLPAGKLLSSVPCRSRKGFSFALYLPSSYQPGARYPVVFCFDPAGRGDVPVRLLQETAETYGFILVGSNNSKNGPWRDILEAQRVLWKVAGQRFKAAPGECYAVGFSGGARAAVYFALAHEKKFSGVVACGAFYPERIRFPKRTRLQFYLLVGNEDFNYFELTRAEKMLGEHGAGHWLSEFPGPHRWPPQAYLGEAFAFFRAEQMRRGGLPTNPDFLERDAARRVLTGKRLAASGLLVAAWREYSQAAALFKGTRAGREAAKHASALQQNPAVSGKLALLPRFEELHRELTRAAGLREQTPVLKELNGILRSGEPGAEWAKLLIQLAVVQYREHAMLSLMQKSYKEAAYYYEAALALSPGDALTHYNAACAFARLGDKEKALNFLEAAVNEGFDRADLMEKDPDLASLRDTPRFIRLIQRIQSRKD